LRVLQEREFERIGSSKTIKVDVRLIAATNKNLQKAIEEGTFRDDLFYRLNVVPIELPPLRERLEDLPRLVDHFIKKYAGETGRTINKVQDDALQMLCDYEWKGNIRELENCIERAVILAEDDTIEARHFLLAPGGNVQAAQTFAIGGRSGGLTAKNGDLPPLPTLREAEQKLIADALARTSGDETAAAKLLGVDVKTLKEKLGTESKKNGRK
jgi:Nif-specific regulatory protein